MREKALVIEDDPNLMLSFKYHLQSMGYDVTHCSWSGLSAMAECAHYDLAIIDVDSDPPATSRLELCPFERIAIPVLVLGFPAGRDEVLAKSMKTARIIQKPFTLEEVREAIDGPPPHLRGGNQLS